MWTVFISNCNVHLQKRIISPQCYPCAFGPFCLLSVSHTNKCKWPVCGVSDCTNIMPVDFDVKQKLVHMFFVLLSLNLSVCCCEINEGIHWIYCVYSILYSNQWSGSIISLFLLILLIVCILSSLFFFFFLQIGMYADWLDHIRNKMGNLMPHGIWNIVCFLLLLLFFLLFVFIFRFWFNLFSEFCFISIDTLFVFAFN